MTDPTIQQVAREAAHLAQLEYWKDETGREPLDHIADAVAKAVLYDLLAHMPGDLGRECLHAALAQFDPLVVTPPRVGKNDSGAVSAAEGAAVSCSVPTPKQDDPLATAAYIRRHGYVEEADLIERMQREIDVSDRLIEMYKSVLDAIPECPAHGACVPHAIEWIKQR